MINLFIDGLCIADAVIKPEGFKKVGIKKECGGGLIQVTTIDFGKYTLEFIGALASFGGKSYNVKKREIKSYVNK